MSIIVRGKTVIGPNLTSGGLVFGYDLDSRYFKGEPTTNYLADGVANIHAFYPGNWLGATVVEVGISEFNTPIYRYTAAGTSYTYTRDEVLDDDLATLSNKTITFSLYIRSVYSGITNCQIRIYDISTGYSYYPHSITSEFTRISEIGRAHV